MLYTIAFYLQCRHLLITPVFCRLMPDSFPTCRASTWTPRSWASRRSSSSPLTTSPPSAATSISYPSWASCRSCSNNCQKRCGISARALGPWKKCSATVQPVRTAACPALGTWSFAGIWNVFCSISTSASAMQGSDYTRNAVFIFLKL